MVDNEVVANSMRAIGLALTERENVQAERDKLLRECESSAIRIAMLQREVALQTGKVEQLEKTLEHRVGNYPTVFKKLEDTEKTLEQCKRTLQIRTDQLSKSERLISLIYHEAYKHMYP